MNTNFSVKELELEGLKLITPFYVEDERGHFLKCVEKDVFGEWGLKADIYEDFESYSKKGVIRGLHFQVVNPQVKIVRAIRGIVHDVVVDIRKGSPTFGKTRSVVLSDENHYSLWIPEGFAHGFEVLSESAIVSYKCIGKYLKESDSGIRWDDPILNIPWRTTEPIISKRDKGLMSFEEFVKQYNGL